MEEEQLNATPTEDEVETVTEDDGNDDVEFTDGADESTEKNETPKAKENSKSESTKERNRKAYETRQRRKEEALKKQAYLDGVKKATKGVNPYTNTPIEDDFDLEEYEIMRELDEDGRDPLADYSQAVKERNKKAQQEQKAKQDRESAERERLDSEMEAFINKYGDDVAKNLLEDKRWEKFSNKLYGKVDVSTIYEMYLDIAAETESQATQLADEKEALRRSSTGRIGKNEVMPKTINQMSDEEFRNFINGQLNKPL